MIAPLIVFTAGLVAMLAAGMHEPTSRWGYLAADAVFITGVGACWYAMVTFALEVTS